MIREWKYFSCIYPMEKKIGGGGGVTKFAHCAYFFACFEISNITETILKVLNKLFKHLFRACFTEWFAQLKS